MLTPADCEKAFIERCVKAEGCVDNFLRQKYSDGSAYSYFWIIFPPDIGVRDAAVVETVLKKFSVHWIITLDDVDLDTFFTNGSSTSYREMVKFLSR